MSGDQQLILDRAGLGKRLRAARTAAGMSLEEAAARARVPHRHLTAIEDGDAGSLPATTYGAAFVKAYAGVLGLDDHAASRTFRRGIERPVVRAAPVAPAPPAVEPAPAARARWPWLVAAAVLLLPVGYGIRRSAMPHGAHRNARVAQPRHATKVPPVPVAAPVPASKSAPAPARSERDDAKTDDLAKHDANDDTASRDRHSHHRHHDRADEASDAAPAETADAAPQATGAVPTAAPAPAPRVPGPAAAPRATAPPPAAKPPEAPPASVAVPHPATAAPVAAPPPRAAAPPPAAPAPATPKPAPPGA